MNKKAKKRDIFDFELGYMVKSPCVECRQKQDVPACYDNCPLLNQIREMLARGVSCQPSSYQPE